MLNKIKSLLPAVLITVALIAVIFPAMMGRSQRKSFIPKPLTDATEAQIREVAMEYTYSTFNIVDGTPVVRLSKFRVTKDELPMYGLDQINFAGEEPPLALVALQGNFDISSLPGMKTTGFGYHYLVYVFDLRVGIPTSIYYSRDGSIFKKLLNDPSLQSEAQPTVNLDDHVPLPEIFPTSIKLPYGSTAPAVAPESP
jgi:hypothetical protein